MKEGVEESSFFKQWVRRKRMPLRGTAVAASSDDGNEEKEGKIYIYMVDMYWKISVNVGKRGKSCVAYTHGQTER